MERHMPPTPIDPLHFIAKPTPQLRAAVAQQQAVLSPADFAELIGGIRAVFQKYFVKLAEFAPGAQRAHAAHQMMEREMKAAAGLPITCGKGCSGCCCYEVEVTSDEGALLAEVVRRGVAIDRERLAVQAERERQSPEWRKFWQPENRCVFLGADGACGSYAWRPAICRKHIVTTPASACVTEGEPVAPVQVLMAEILLSAALSQPGVVFASLSKQLTKALEFLEDQPREQSNPLGYLPDEARAPVGYHLTEQS
jgi:Fe-S-cluster containining protein